MRHADIVKNYIEKNHKETLSSIKIECISSTTCSSPGDALRELDSLGVIRSDPFIMMTSDTVCNIKLDQVIQFHKDKRKDDPNMIMTTIFRETRSNSRSVADDLVVAYDSNTSQIVLFENDMKSSFCRLPSEILSDHPSIQFNTSLQDCFIDICSPEVLVQFSDNFDYQDIRKDFIRNEVVNFELGMHIYGSYVHRFILTSQINSTE
jgi:translation initiation factor eIF-2B subunit epsilon